MTAHHPHPPHLHMPSRRSVALAVCGLALGFTVTTGLDAVYLGAQETAPHRAASAVVATVRGTNPLARAPLTVRASLDEYRFRPAKLTVRAGTRVVWTNHANLRHNIKLPGSPPSPLFGRGSSFAHTFDKPGTYRVNCPIHPGMVAVVTVTG